MQARWSDRLPMVLFVALLVGGVWALIADASDEQPADDETADEVRADAAPTTTASTRATVQVVRADGLVPTAAIASPAESQRYFPFWNRNSFVVVSTTGQARDGVLGIRIERYVDEQGWLDVDPSGLDALEGFGIDSVGGSPDGYQVFGQLYADVVINDRPQDVPVNWLLSTGEEGVTFFPRPENDDRNNPPRFASWDELGVPLNDPARSGNTGGALRWFSPDGTAFEVRDDGPDLGPFPDELRFESGSGGLVVALRDLPFALNEDEVGTQPIVISRSGDGGQTWEHNIDTGIDGVAVGLAGGPAGFVLSTVDVDTNAAGPMFFSADGMRWTELDLAMSGEFEAWSSMVSVGRSQALVAHREFNGGAFSWVLVDVG